MGKRQAKGDGLFSNTENDDQTLSQSSHRQSRTHPRPVRPGLQHSSFGTLLSLIIILNLKLKTYKYLTSLDRLIHDKSTLVSTT